MATWFRVESTMVMHPKVYRLAELLKLKPAGGVKPSTMAAGLVVGVWSWVTQNAADGDLSGVSPSAIAEAAGWTKRADVFFDALIDAGFIDREGDELWLHDWIDYAGKLIEQEAKKKADTAERVRKHREAQRQEKAAAAQRNAAVAQCNVQDAPPCNAECNSYSNVTVTPDVTQCNAPYVTVRNDTLHNDLSIQDRRIGLDSTSTEERDDPVMSSPVTLPEWVNDPEYIPTTAEIEALPDMALRMKYVKLRTQRIMRGNG